MNKLFLLIVSLLIFSCSPSRFVQPLEKDQQALSFHMGGSLIDYSGLTIPVPLTSITYGNGLKENLTLYGSLHTTSLLFNNLHLEVGGLTKIKHQENWIPAISSALTLNYVSELTLGNTKLWPQMDANFYWNFKEQKHRLYVGCSAWIDPNLLNDNIGVIHPHLGYNRRIGKWQLGAELKFLASGYNNSKTFVPYKSLLGDYGATGFYLNITKPF